MKYLTDYWIKQGCASRTAKEEKGQQFLSPFKQVLYTKLNGTLENT